MLSTLLCTAPSSLSIDDTDIQHSRARLYSYPAMMPGNTASSSVTPARSNSVRSKYKFTMSGSRSVSTSVATFDATPTAESPTPSQSHRPFMKKRRQFSLQLPLPLSSASGGTRSLLRSGSLSGRVTVKDKGKPPAKDEDAVSLGIHGLKISPPTAFRHQFHLGKDMTGENEDRGSNSGHGFGSENNVCASWDEARWREVIEKRMTEYTTLDNEDYVQIDHADSGLVCAALVHKREGQKEKRSSTSTNTSLTSSTSMSKRSSVMWIDSVEDANMSRICGDSMGEISMTTTVIPPSPQTSVAVSTPPFTRAQKRASLVRRKPVPPLYPDENTSSPEPGPKQKPSSEQDLTIATAMTSSTSSAEHPSPLVEETVIQIEKEQDITTTSASMTTTDSPTPRLRTHANSPPVPARSPKRLSILVRVPPPSSAPATSCELSEDVDASNAQRDEKLAKAEDVADTNRATEDANKKLEDRRSEGDTEILRLSLESSTSTGGESVTDSVLPSTPIDECSIDDHAINDHRAADDTYDNVPIHNEGMADDGIPNKTSTNEY